MLQACSEYRCPSRSQFYDNDQDDFVLVILIMPTKMTNGDKDDDNIDPSGIQLDSALQLDYGI